MKLVQKTLAQVTAADANKRVVVIDGGNSFVGRLAEFHIYTNEYKEYVPYVNLTVRGLESKSTLQLRSLPLEFVLQIEDTDAEAD